MKRIKNNMRILLLALCGAGAAASCSDMFELESKSVVFDPTLNTSNDSLYSAMGILAQMQQLGERYVLMGELRGDLMRTTADAVEALQEVADFNVSAGNTYCDMTDYYSVINNCNYAITRMDTSIVNFDTKVMLPEFVAIKTMRAWTYWQIALLRGDVKWMTEPVTNLEESVRDYPVVGIDELAEKLIEDLTPYIGTRGLNYGQIGSFSSEYYFIPMDLLLGDLYLYLNRYEEAAQTYYRYIYNHSLAVTWGYKSICSDAGYAVSSNFTTSYVEELLCGLPSNEDPTGYHPELIRLAYNYIPAIVPAETFVDSMARKPYFYRMNEGSTGVRENIFSGDLRGSMVSRNGSDVSVSYGRYADKTDKMLTLITKYRSVSSSHSGYDPQNEFVGNSLVYPVIVPLYRRVMVYLRFAEALNRTGRPSMALAVLRYGLSRTTTTEGENMRVNPWEVNAPYTDFTDSRFDSNRGTMGRGRGYAVDAYAAADVNKYLGIPDFTRETAEVPVKDEQGNIVYPQATDDEGNLLWEDEEQTIPIYSTEPEMMTVNVHTEESMNDSIEFVENLIIDEMAAETAFEGNRFFDLLRIARHRGQFPAYMADKVSDRFGEAGKAAKKAELLNRDKWFLK